MDLSTSAQFREGAYLVLPRSLMPHTSSHEFETISLIFKVKNNFFLRPIVHPFEKPKRVHYFPVLSCQSNVNWKIERVLCRLKHCFCYSTFRAKTPKLADYLSSILLIWLKKYIHIWTHKNVFYCSQEFGCYGNNFWKHLPSNGQTSNILTKLSITKLLRIWFYTTLWLKVLS